MCPMWQVQKENMNRQGPRGEKNGALSLHLAHLYHMMPNIVTYFHSMHAAFMHETDCFDTMHLYIFS